MNQWEMLGRFVEACELDVVLLAGRYTLLDRSAAVSFLPRCLERNVAVVVGGVFNSGILARGNSPDDATFNYAQAPPAVVAQVRALARACKAHGRSLSAAALQFPLRHPAVACVLAGMRDAAEVRANAAAFGEAVPAQLWAEVDAIVGASAPG
jgi:D-threo-aldose 1-dehydrogenase